jgi:hypothetical protein
VVCWCVVLLQGGGGGAMLTCGGLGCGCGDGCIGRHASSESGHTSFLCCTFLLHRVVDSSLI